jgi:hypothetical protein
MLALEATHISEALSSLSLENLLHEAKANVERSLSFTEIEASSPCSQMILPHTG